MKVRSILVLLGSLTASALGAACGDGGGGGEAGGGGSSSSSSGSTSSGSSSSSGSTSSSSSSGSTSSSSGSSGAPSGWLYTVPGENKIYVDDGQPKTVWMGRGVNLDDLFLCGYNAGFWMGPEGEKALLGVVSSMMAEWKPTFVRVSLGMNTFEPSVSWLESSAYKTTMIKAIEAVGAHPGTYVLVTLRSDASMVTPDGQECGHGDDAICLPTSATDDTYRALVDTFKDAPYVLFGVANEPGGMASDNADIAARMAHAVEVIRAREDALGTPHHLVAVQGNQWTSKIGFYDSAPLPYEGVVYEYHSYPPQASGEAAYTQAHIPVIIGEYGPDGADLSFASAFFADVEAKHIPNLAWSLSPYSNCAPDLVQVSQSTTLTTTEWGDVVKSYLLAH